MSETQKQKASELLFDGRYELLREVKGAPSLGRITIGSKNECRYCESRAQSVFRRVAHTFPEALGNKWIVSLDDCDKCNDKFLLYESALADAVSPFLTIGGVKGKGNKTRQTGRTGGDSVLVRRRDTGGAQIAAVVRNSNWRDNLRHGIDGTLRLEFPIAGVPFKPQHAYKALSKMGFALLPEQELPNFQKLKAWILDTDDTIDFLILECSMSFASIGNASPLVSGTILRRVDPLGMHPHILFFCRISLFSD